MVADTQNGITDKVCALLWVFGIENPKELVELAKIGVLEVCRGEEMIALGNWSEK